MSLPVKFDRILAFGCPKVKAAARRLSQSEPDARLSAMVLFQHRCRDHEHRWRAAVHRCGRAVVTTDQGGLIVAPQIVS